MYWDQAATEQKYNNIHLQYTSLFTNKTSGFALLWFLLFIDAGLLVTGNLDIVLVSYLLFYSNSENNSSSANIQFAYMRLENF